MPRCGFGPVRGGRSTVSEAGWAGWSFAPRSTGPGPVGALDVGLYPARLGAGWVTPVIPVEAGKLVRVGFATFLR